MSFAISDLNWLMILGKRPPNCLWGLALSCPVTTILRRCLEALADRNIWIGLFFKDIHCHIDDIGTMFLKMGLPRINIEKVARSHSIFWSPHLFSLFLFDIPRHIYKVDCRKSILLINIILRFPRLSPPLSSSSQASAMPQFKEGDKVNYKPVGGTVCALLTTNIT